MKSEQEILDTLDGLLDLGLRLDRDFVEYPFPEVLAVKTANQAIIKILGWVLDLT